MNARNATDLHNGLSQEDLWHFVRPTAWQHVHCMGSLCISMQSHAYLEQRSWGNVIGDSRPLLHFNLHQICLLHRQNWLGLNMQIHVFSSMWSANRRKHLSDSKPQYLIYHWDTRTHPSCHFEILEQLTVAFLPDCIFVRTQQTLSGWNTISR